MDKNDIAVKVATRAGIHQAKARQIVHMVFEDMMDCLVSEGNLELRNFGIFKVKTRKSKPARNPKTGEEVMVPERKVVKFKPGRIMLERVTGRKA